MVQVKTGEGKRGGGEKEVYPCCYKRLSLELLFNLTNNSNNNKIFWYSENLCLLHVYLVKYLPKILRDA